MSSAFQMFQQTKDEVRGLVGLHGVLTTMTTGVLDKSDILRACIVFGVSAFDAYIHENVREKMVSTFEGRRTVAKAYGSFSIPLTVHVQLVANSNTSLAFDNFVRQHHAWKSFQSPDKVADALRLITDVDLWQSVATGLGKDAKAVKNELTTIVDRRNKIAHEADLDPTSYGSKWPISSQLVTASLDFLESVVVQIDSLT